MIFVGALDEHILPVPNSSDRAGLSIVLPCYNPQLHPHWVETIVSNMHRIKEMVGDCELIVVNDGTPADIEAGLAAVQEAFGNTRIVSYAVNRGKGYAVRQGIAVASRPLVIYTDIDFPYCHESLVAVYEKLQQPGVDIVVGVKGSEYYNRVPFLRKKVSEALRWMIRHLLSIRITDTQCGLKGFHGELKSLWLNGTIDRYLFDLEMVYNAERQGHHIATLPVVLRDGVQFSPVKTRILMGELRNFLAIARQSRKRNERTE